MRLLIHCLKKAVPAVLAALFVISVSITADAAARTVKGDGGGTWNFVSETAVPAESYDAAEEVSSAAGTGSSVDVSSGPGGQTVYEFEGKKYVIESDWGLHYLTGFCPNADGSRRTRSGVDAQANHTAASTAANLGKVILIEAESGKGDFHRYDGIYKCEDTGGQAVETGKENTGYVPVVDIFFDTAEEAAQTTASGWINARIYILREVN